MALSEREEFELLSLERERSGVKSVAPIAPAKPAVAKVPPPKSAIPETGRILEVPRTALQNTIAQIASGYAGAAGAALPGAPGQGARWQKATAGALSHDPVDPGSRAILSGLSLPAEYLVEKPSHFLGGKIADLGYPATGAIVEGAGNAAPMALGLRGFKFNPSPTAQLAKQSKFALTPSEGGGGVVSKVAEGLSGEEKLSKAISRKNSEEGARAVAKDIGVPEGTPLTRESIATARRAAHQPYEEARGLGQIQTSVAYNQALDKIAAPYVNAKRSFPKGTSDIAQKVQESVEGHKVKAFDASAAVDEIGALREAANREYAKGDPALGKAYKGVARAIEDQFVEHVQTLGEGQPALLQPHRGLVDRLQGARERIAKTYDADRALEKDGAINPQAYKAMEKRGKKLSGAAQDLAKLAEDAPRSFRRDSGGNVLFPTWEDMILSGMSGAGQVATHGATAGATLPAGLALVARPAVRGVLASRPYQALQASPVPSAIGYGTPFASTMAEIARRAAAEQQQEQRK